VDLHNDDLTLNPEKIGEIQAEVKNWGD
jgi:hypothetical protein